MITTNDLVRLIREDFGKKPDDVLAELGLNAATIEEFISGYVTANVLPALAVARTEGTFVETLGSYLMATAGRMLALGIAAGRQYPAPAREDPARV